MGVEIKNPDQALLNELSNPEVQESLVVLIQKLPMVKDAINKVEQGIQAVSSFTEDTSSLNYLAETADKLSKAALNKETIEAIGVLLDKLPKLAEMMALLDKVAPLINTVASRDFLVAASESVELVADPIKERIQEGKSIFSEAKERAALNNTTVSIFGILKLLKEPVVQDGLKFALAFLEVMSERRGLK